MRCTRGTYCIPCAEPAGHNPHLCLQQKLHADPGADMLRARRATCRARSSTSTPRPATLNASPRRSRPPQHRSGRGHQGAVPRAGTDTHGVAAKLGGVLYDLRQVSLSCAHAGADANVALDAAHRCCTDAAAAAAAAALLSCRCR
eukprot:364943-Chlamydomonas_euryale.AAC.2